MTIDESLQPFLTRYEKDKDMGPLIALLLKYLPQLIESLVKKDQFAAKNGFKGPGEVLVELLADNTVKAKLDELAATYDRCCKDMPPQ